MKLTNHIVLILTSLLVVDYCSASLFGSQFQGKWCEHAIARYNISKFMTDLGFSNKSINAYLYGKPTTIDIDYDIKNQTQVICGEDPIGSSFQVDFYRKQNQRLRKYFFGTHVWFISSYNSNEFNMSCYQEYEDVNPYFTVKIAEVDGGYLRFLATSDQLQITASSDFYRC